MDSQNVSTTTCSCSTPFTTSTVSTNNSWTNECTIWPNPKVRRVVELELTDGTRTAVRISFDDMQHIVERRREDGTHYVDFDLVSCGKTENMEVNCTLSALMRLLGVEYERWDDTVMRDSIEYGP